MTLMQITWIGEVAALFIRVDFRPVNPGLSVAYQVEPADQARREYDRLSASATVVSDIPPSERVCDPGRIAQGHHQPASGRRASSRPGGMLKDPVVRREREVAILRQRVELTGAFRYRIKPARTHQSLTVLP
jgi:hypothetical protein